MWIEEITLEGDLVTRDIHRVADEDASTTLMATIETRLAATEPATECALDS